MSYRSNYLEFKNSRDVLLANTKPAQNRRGNSRAVICVESGERWPSASEAARRLRLHNNRIPDAIAKEGKVKVDGKMVSFRYVEDEK